MLHEQFTTLVVFKYLVALKTILHEIKTLVALKTMLHKIKTLVALKTILHEIKTLVALKTMLHEQFTTCCDMGQNDTIGKIELNSSFVLSSDNTNCKNDIQ